MSTTESTPIIIDQTTILSLALVLVLLLAAYLSSLRLLPTTTHYSLRILFIWHLFDALIHFIFEGSYLYNCFFTSTPYSPTTPSLYQTLDPTAGNNFLAQRNRTYGSFYGAEGNAFASLWRVYANADRRWGGADETVISLELLTVFGAGPLALLVCTGIAKRWNSIYFWMVVLATAELYGGFITFCPEWLTGNQNLDTSNFMYLYVYLIFFNTLWVWLPLYALYISYRNISRAFLLVDTTTMATGRKQARNTKGKFLDDKKES